MEQTGTARRRLTRVESQRRTREHLMTAAADVFSRRGFHAASVEEVAEAAGYSKGAVYSNFASKDDLFLALLDRHLAQELAAVAHRIAPDPARADGLTEPPHPFSRHLEEGRTWNILAMEFWLYAMRDERARERLAARYRAARGDLAARLRGQDAEGTARSHAAAAPVAWAVLALGLGLALQAYLEPGVMPQDVYAVAIDRLLTDPAAACGGSQGEDLAPLPG